MFQNQLAFLSALVLIVLGGVVGTGANTAYATSQSLFQNLDGRWTGWGWLELSSGDRERVRCRIIYRLTSSNEASQHLRCASASYKIDATANMKNSGGRISGDWSESTYDARGSISGRASKKHMSVSLSGNNFSAGMSVTSDGRCRQFVKIRPGDGDIKIISVGLKRC